MNLSSRSLLCLVVLTFISTTEIHAQTKKSIDASIGFGFSFPYDDIDIGGSGFYAQGEYVFKFSKWIDVRPYAGLIIANSNISNEQLEAFGFKSTASALMLGGKARLTFPIPWIAPYLETGIGASIGSFETITPFTNKKDSGILIHIPVSIGLKLGSNRNFDLSFSYYMHPSAEQFVGSAAIGLTFPLSKWFFCLKRLKVDCVKKNNRTSFNDVYEHWNNLLLKEHFYLISRNLKP